MTTRPIYQQLAISIDAMKRCVETDNREWYLKHRDTIESIVRNHMPSGSGIDNGTSMDLDRSNGERLVFNTSFHHMDDAGMYDGWTEHNVTVKASMIFTIDVSVSGRNRNDIKDYLHQMFSACLLEAFDDAELLKVSA